MKIDQLLLGKRSLQERSTSRSYLIREATGMMGRGAAAELVYEEMGGKSSAGLPLFSVAIINSTGEMPMVTVSLSRP